MDILWFILIGLCAGWLAGVLYKGSGYGVVGNLIVGVVGAIVGGFVFRLIGVETMGLLGSLITATVGAVLLLVLLSLVSKKK